MQKLQGKYTLLKKVNCKLAAIFTCCILLLISFLAQAQNFSAKASTSKRTFIIGDSIGVLVETDLPEGYTYRLQNVPALQGLEWLDSSALGKQFNTKKHIFTLTGFDSGMFVFPPLQLVFLDNTGKEAGTAATKPFSIHVNYADVDTTQEIKPIVAPLQVDYRPFPYWLPALIAVLLLLAFIIYKWKKKKPKPVLQELPNIHQPKNNLHYAEEALRQIDLLQEEKNDGPKYWFGLKEILRGYISKRYNMATQEKTSSQLLEELKKQENQENVMLLKHFFEKADMALFANTKTGDAEKAEAAQQAVHFIKQSRK